MKDRRVLVTGGSRGIGRAIAIALGASGFAVTVHYRTGRAEAEAVAAEIGDHGGTASTLGFDVRDREAARESLEREIADGGAFWGVVCNAGITADNAFPAMTSEDWDSVIRTNLDGFYNVLNPLVMPMVQARQGGRIVTMASVSGLMGNRGQVNYSAAKAGIMGATKALAVELARRRITVNCVAPGLIDTDMLDERVVDEALGMIPARRVGTSEEVAGLVAYLFSDSAGYVTRQVISVNGGML